LNDIYKAHGGEERWRSVESIEVLVSVRGLLFTLKRMPTMDHLRMTIQVRQPAVVVHGYPHAGKNTHFLGEDRVEIRDDQGYVLDARDAPRSYFRRIRRRFYWDELDFAYFSGYAMWNYMTMPFLFQMPGVEVRRSVYPGPDGADGYDVRFPPGLPTHCREQTFYFDRAGHLCRHDYTAEVVGAWAKAAHCCEEYRQFSGLSLPTKRRVYPKLFGGDAIQGDHLGGDRYT
jgi:hypothetical protein